jgi:hypothetical protein
VGRPDAPMQSMNDADLHNVRVAFLILSAAVVSTPAVRGSACWQVEAVPPMPHGIDPALVARLRFQHARRRRRFRILAIVDDFNRECLTMMVDTSLGGVRVLRNLERLALKRGTPQVIVRATTARS